MKKKIGFVNYENTEAETTEQSLVCIPIDTDVSNSHADLLGRINCVSNLILSEEFSSMTGEQKTNYLTVLISSVALDAELKTLKGAK